VFVPEAALTGFVDEVLASWREAFPEILANP
jgi:hypothetical protein